MNGAVKAVSMWSFIRGCNDDGNGEAHALLPTSALSAYHYRKLEEKKKNKYIVLG